LIEEKVLVKRKAAKGSWEWKMNPTDELKGMPRRRGSAVACQFSRKILTEPFDPHRNETIVVERQNTDVGYSVAITRTLRDAKIGPWSATWRSSSSSPGAFRKKKERKPCFISTISRKRGYGHGRPDRTESHTLVHQTNERGWSL